MHVDPARREPAPVRAALAVARRIDPADRHDASVVHRHVAAKGRRAAPVDDPRVPDDQIMHRSLLLDSASRAPGQPAPIGANSRRRSRLTIMPLWLRGNGTGWTSTSTGTL